ncbi:MAG: hypothetical protein M1820_002145 [Bogoriella megaspora]|nr:MAG: hypothetical protein M1820_002145 [Bogoriella megaspora]
MEDHIINLPLEDFSDENNSQLFSCLWHCGLCDACQNQGQCQDLGYTSTGTQRLGRYTEYYRQATTFYEPYVELGVTPTLNNHRDLFTLIRRLKSKTHLPRNQLMNELFNHDCNASDSLAQDRDEVLKLAIRIMIMVEDGVLASRWSGHLAFTQYMAKLFPQTDHSAVNCDANRSSMGLETAIKAPKLQKRVGLKFRPADNLRDHLRLDHTSRTIDIFHHTAFLKEHLRASYHQRQHEMEAWSNGIIPRQLALEVIDSIQKILFPLTDPKCRKMLQQLVSTSNFDPDCLRFESASIRSPEEQDITYTYLGTRLADLYEETQNPKPYSLLDKWLERKSGARYTTLVALIGIAIAILLGLLTLVVSIYQAYISYQAWQHPVSNR